MKAEIHPAYFKKATITCGCGQKIVLGSTIEDIKVEICSSCHPFYTGKEKIIDTAGKVEKFKAARIKAKEVGPKKKKAEKRAAKTAKKEKEEK